MNTGFSLTESFANLFDDFPRIRLEIIFREFKDDPSVPDNTFCLECSCTQFYSLQPPLTVFSLDLHTNDLTRNGALFVSSFLERFLDRSDVSYKIEFGSTNDRSVKHTRAFRIQGTLPCKFLRGMLITKCSDVDYIAKAYCRSLSKV